jgi:hypothetical protein
MTLQPWFWVWKFFKYTRRIILSPSPHLSLPSLFFCLSLSWNFRFGGKHDAACKWCYASQRHGATPRRGPYSLDRRFGVLDGWELPPNLLQWNWHNIISLSLLYLYFCIIRVLLYDYLNTFFKEHCYLIRKIYTRKRRIHKIREFNQS